MSKTFRGIIADEGIEKIRLGTNNGLTGYRVVKFECIYQDPGGTNGEAVMKIFTVPQSTTTDKIDFSDPTLLAAAYIENRNNNDSFGGQTIIFDNVIFNQDIYITFNESNSAAVLCNYHIELKTSKLDLNEATVATLKDMRGRE